MDAVRSSALLLHVEHRHGDDWVRLEPTPEHDVAESDPERSWPRGRIYACPTCEEQVRVALEPSEGTPD